ncbi:hypothetical protein GCM10027082_01370 [Comamonas humi]
MNLLRQTQTVLWSLIGIGRCKDMAEIPERGNPLVLVVIAFVLVMLFVGTIAFVAHSVAPG